MWLYQWDGCITGVGSNFMTKAWLKHQTFSSCMYCNMAQSGVLLPLTLTIALTLHISKFEKNVSVDRRVNMLV